MAVMPRHRYSSPRPQPGKARRPGVLRQGKKDQAWRPGSRSGATPPWWWWGHHSARRGAASCQKKWNAGQAWGQLLVFTLLSRISHYMSRCPMFTKSLDVVVEDRGSSLEEFQCFWHLLRSKEQLLVSTLLPKLSSSISRLPRVHFVFCWGCGG